MKRGAGRGVVARRTVGMASRRDSRERGLFLGELRSAAPSQAVDVDQCDRIIALLGKLKDKVCPQDRFRAEFIYPHAYHLHDGGRKFPAE